MSEIRCFRGHVEPVPGCPSCKSLATNDRYRAELAKRQGLPPPPKVEQGQPATNGEAGLFRKAANFAKAVTRHVSHGMPTVSEEVKQQRLALCVVCEHYNAAKETCRKCGCNLKTKTSWALEKCPIGKW